MSWENFLTSIMFGLDSVPTNSTNHSFTVTSAIPSPMSESRKGMVRFCRAGKRNWVKREGVSSCF